jgi:hypothetical protein
MYTSQNEGGTRGERPRLRPMYSPIYQCRYAMTTILVRISDTSLPPEPQAFGRAITVATMIFITVESGPDWRWWRRDPPVPEGGSISGW